MEISLHLGAHKTGTTFIQDTLLVNRSLLAMYGVGFIPLKQLRRTVTRALNDRAPPAAIASAQRALKRAPVRRLVLSDENILARLHYRRERAGLYPTATNRLLRLRRLGLERHRLTVLFCIRRYDEYLSSLYCETLRHRDFLTFDEFMSQYDFSRISWLEVLGAIQRALPGATFLVWDFDTFKQDPIRIVASIAGVPTQMIPGNVSPARESLSDPAVAELTSLRASMSNAEIRGQVEFVAKRFPRSAGHAPFRPFSKSEEGVLRNLHGEHWEQMRQSFPTL